MTTEAPVIVLVVMLAEPWAFRLELSTLNLMGSSTVLSF